jgi:hypothetical protein
MQLISEIIKISKEIPRIFQKRKDKWEVVSMILEKIDELDSYIIACEEFLETYSENNQDIINIVKKFEEEYNNERCWYRKIVEMFVTKEREE